MTHYDITMSKTLKFEKTLPNKIYSSYKPYFLPIYLPNNSHGMLGEQQKSL